MASIFFTESLPGIFDISERDVVDMATAGLVFEGFSGSSLTSIGGRQTGQSGLSFQSWRPCQIRLLKSRVYAKLLTRPILECYQTFNG
jgi:hypothetical protein